MLPSPGGKQPEPKNKNPLPNHLISLVDGEKRFVQVIKANHMSQPAQTKKICERMVFQEKVHVLWGTDGSNLMKILNETANKYKVIAQCTAALRRDL